MREYKSSQGFELSKATLEEIPGQVIYKNDCQR